MRILVTGAGGFVGRHLSACLTAQKLDFVAAPRSLLGEGSTDSVDLGRFSAVIHLAALAHEAAERYERSGNYEALRSFNAKSTEWLALEAARAGVRHFVFMSSIAVHGDQTQGSPFTEESPTRPRSLYGQSKLEAENRLGEVAAATGLRVCTLRPTLVYGPQNPGNFRRLMTVIQRGYPLPFGSVHNRRSFTFVGNLVAAVQTAIQTQAEGAYIISDNERLSTPDLIRHLASALEVPNRVFPCPQILLRMAGNIAGRPDLVRRLVESLEVDAGKFQRTTGWRPPYAAEEGLKDTARSFKRRVGTGY